MFRTVRRVLGCSAVVVAVALGIAHTPNVLLTCLSWLLFGYLVRSAWPVLVADVRALRAVRLPFTSPGGRFSNRRGDGGTL